MVDLSYMVYVIMELTSLIPLKLEESSKKSSRQKKFFFFLTSCTKTSLSVWVNVNGRGCKEVTISHLISLILPFRTLWAVSYGISVIELCKNTVGFLCAFCLEYLCVQQIGLKCKVKTSAAHS